MSSSRPPDLGGEGAPGLVGLLGLVIDEIAPDRVTGHLRIEEHHLQGYGVVHGGVYAAVAETLASVGGAVSTMQRDPSLGVVGLENHTTFLRTARAGTEVVAEATPMHAGRRTQAWQVSMRDAGNGKELATSRVRLIVTAPDTI